MQPSDWITFVIAFIVALLIGTLVEYAVHRLMHAGKVLAKTHARHHREGVGQGWAGEFHDYFFPVVPILWIGFLFSVPVGVGWAVGATAYAAFAAYAHQLQHERPEMCFWLRRPVHHLHHHHKMWRHNFGISVSIWDHVFGTYKREEWGPEKRLRQHAVTDLLRIKWF